MNDKTKLYVFNRKEVALIFAFMILVAVTSFVFGVKIGKNYSYKQAGLEMQDRERVELLSAQEESVTETVQKEAATASDEVAKKQILDQTYDRLKAEFNKLEEKKEVDAEDDIIEAAAPEAKVEAPAPKAEAPKEEKKDELAGKYTIQLGAHRSLDDAKKFAEGFKIRGYDPVIINKVEIEGRGTWYRVSLGVFETFSEAKKFILKEQSLFKGMDPFVAEFK